MVRRGHEGLKSRNVPKTNRWVCVLALSGRGYNNLLVIRRPADQMLASRAIVMEEGSTPERQ